MESSNSDSGSQGFNESFDLESEEEESDDDHQPAA